MYTINNHAPGFCYANIRYLNNQSKNCYCNKTYSLSNSVCDSLKR